MGKPVLPALATASGMLMFALPAAAQAEGSCVPGARPAQSVGGGQDLVLCGGRFNGSINVHPGGSLYAINTRIAGSITAEGATAVTLCNDRIGGGVSIHGTTGPVFVGDPDDGCGGNTTGALVVDHNRRRVDVSDNVIHGSLSFDNNLGSEDSRLCGPACTFEPEMGDNMVFGAIDCEDNGGTPGGVFTDGGPDTAVGAILGDCAHEGTMK